MQLNYPGDLPIVAEKKAIVEAIQKNQVVIIAGETGSGKTTQLPKMCLEALPNLLKNTIIGVTQPRRIAASSVATRVADELQEAGHIVGHKIRFYDKTTAATRIKFMTDGVLLAETKNDKLLRQYNVLIIDEAHERSLNIDFLLGYLKTLLPKRPELKLLITSATIDTEAFARHFADAPIISVPGRSYPVEISYHPIAETSVEKNEEQEGKVEHAVAVLDELFQSRPQGDILLFLPTEQDILQCCSLLEGRYQATTVLPLFGRLAAGDQARIFRPTKGIKIIVATNVAETSITVPGIRYVIDSGYARISRYNVRARTTALPVSKISQASARQRAGRAGRIAPGFCLRLYAEEDFLQREKFTVPEIQRANLAEVILQMISFRLGEPENFPFLDPPHPAAIREGYTLLRELGALQGNNRLTPKGRIMARLPVDPCISCILLEAKENNSLTEVTIIAAVLAIQDPRIRPAESEQQADEAHRRFRHKYSDFLSLLTIWQDYHQDNDKAQSWSALKRYCKKNYLSFQRMREWIDLHAQLVRILNREKDAFIFNRNPAGYEQIHKALLCGFLRNIARKKQEEDRGKYSNSAPKTKHKNIFQGGQSKELSIFPGSGLFAKPPEWILAANFMETSRLYALTVAAIEPEWIEMAASHLCNYSWSDPLWHKKSGQVMARETVSLFGLIVNTRDRVNFGKRSKKNIAEARSIFIQQALLTGQLNGSYSFLDHNMALLQKWEESEAKLRNRNLIVDEQNLAQFYAKKLPENIYSQPLLNRFLKKKKEQDFLKMRESDILARDFVDHELLDFPKKRMISGIDISIDYVFSPGSKEDGITFRLPVLFAQNIQLHYFDWLVPGLLGEKTTFLLKGLVKSLRKRLIPIQQSVDYILDEINFGKGDLLTAIEAAIFKRFKITIHRSDWPQELPPHLTPRFLLFDDNDRELAAGRNLSILLQKVSLSRGEMPKKDSGKESPLIARWRGTTHTNWDFDALPEEIPTFTAAGEISGFLYPALHTDKQQGVITVGFSQNKIEAQQINEEALLYLFSLQFRESCKQLKRLISTSFSGPSTLFLANLQKTKPEITALLLTSLLKQIYGKYGQGRPASNEFTSRVAAVKKEGFYHCGQLKWEQFMAALRKRRAVSEQLTAFLNKNKTNGSFYQEGYRRLEQELQAIFPAQIIYRNSNYQEISRQLDYLSLRLERFYANPLKDEQKQAQIEPFINKLQSIAQKRQLSDEAERALQEYKEMLMEFKISVFAPEIKRRFPVSAKKLTIQWQQAVKYLPLQ